MIETRVFERRTFRVQAVQVTIENMQELADWSGGEITAAFREGGDADFCIQIVATWANGRKNKHRAFVGDWLTRLTDANNFRIYKDKPFGEHFVELPSNEEKRQRAAKLVEDAAYDIKMGAFSQSSEEVIINAVVEELAALFAAN